LKVEYLIMLLKQCEPKAEVEIQSEYDDLFLPYDIETHFGSYITIMTVYKKER